MVDAKKCANGNLLTEKELRESYELEVDLVTKYGEKPRTVCDIVQQAALYEAIDTYDPAIICDPLARPGTKPVPEFNPFGYQPSLLCREMLNYREIHKYDFTELPGLDRRDYAFSDALLKQRVQWKGPMPSGWSDFTNPELSGLDQDAAFADAILTLYAEEGNPPLISLGVRDRVDAGQSDPALQVAPEPLRARDDVRPNENSEGDCLRETEPWMACVRTCSAAVRAALGPDADPAESLELVSACTGEQCAEYTKPPYVSSHCASDIFGP